MRAFVSMGLRPNRQRNAYAKAGDLCSPSLTNTILPCIGEEFLKRMMAGKPISLVCDLDSQPGRKGEVYGICESA